MGRTQRITYLHVVFICLAVILFAAAVFLILRTARTEARESRFNAAVGKIDFLINERNDEKAKKLLRELVPEAKSAQEWLRVLKRSRMLALRTKDFAFYRETALEALKSVSGNQRVRAVAVSALLAAGEAEEALRIAENHLEENEYRSLLAEAYLGAGILPEGAENGLELARLSRTSRPEDFLRAGDLTGNKLYHLDAALLYLQSGDILSGAELLSREGIAETRPLPGILANLDAGRLDEAKRILKLFTPKDSNLGLISLLSADIALRSSHDAEALQNYSYVRKAYPETGPESFLSEAYLLAKNDPAAALYVLREGLAAYPADRRLALSLIRLDIGLGQIDSARNTLDFTEAVSGPDPDTRLFRLLLRQQTLPPGRFIGELWILANSAPDHEAAGRILTEQLFGISDFSGLEALLDNPKNLSWKSFYRGVLLFALGRYDEAGDEFEKIASSGPDALFNLGMARLAAKDLSAAIKAFKHVLVLDPDYEGAGKILRKLEALSVSW